MAWPALNPSRPAWPASAEPGSGAAGSGWGAAAGAGTGSVFGSVPVKLPVLGPDAGALNAAPLAPLLLKEELPESAATALPAPRPFRFSSRPAAMTVTRT